MSVMVRIEHVREAQRRHGGYCVRGVGIWLTRYGMTLRELINEGYPEERILATNDAFGVAVVAIANERSNGGAA